MRRQGYPVVLAETGRARVDVPSTSGGITIQVFGGSFDVSSFLLGFDFECLSK